MTKVTDGLMSIPLPHLRVRREWLALRREDPLEPEREVVDVHHHLSALLAGIACDVCGLAKKAG